MSNDLHHLSGAYALDALDPDERAAFEAHYPSCDICAAEVLEFREAAAVLAADAAVAPPDDLKARVMAEVTQTRQLSPLSNRVDDLAERRNTRRWAGRALAAAAAAVVLVVGLVGLLRSGSDDYPEVVAADDAVFITLEGEAGAIETIWSPERDQVALRASSLAGAGPGQTYALWLLLGDQVMPAGLFEPDDDGILKAVLDLDAAEVGGWGVSIEPEGGSPQPTGPVLFVGQA